MNTGSKPEVQALQEKLRMDPAGLSAVDPTNPQMWNRYAYARNNPLSHVDPSGLYLVSSGGCTYDVIDSYLNGQYTGTSVNFISCGPIFPNTSLSQISHPGSSSQSQSGTTSASAPSKTGCFAKGAIAGAATALVVGAVATLAAPVVGATAMTVGLAALAVAGSASLAWNATQDIINHNWTGVAYDAGSLVGRLATGIAVGSRVATSIDRNATPGWSPQIWRAQAYDSAKGSLSGWMATGPTQASAGVSTGVGGWLSSLLGAGFH